MSKNAEKEDNNLRSTSDNVVVTVLEEDDGVGEKPESTFEEKKSYSIKSIKMRYIMMSIALITFLLSFPLLFESIWLLYVEEYLCEGLLKTLPRLQIGIAIGLIAMFFLSNGIVYLRTWWLGLGLIVVMIPLVVMFVVGISLSGSFRVETRHVPGSPGWLNAHVLEEKNWNNIKLCLYKAKFCKVLIQRLSYEEMKPYNLSTIKLSPIESGCCKPPSICGMVYMNMTFWMKNGNDIGKKDCDRWENKESRLCYDCNACKGGFVKSVEKKWLKLGRFLVATSVLLMIFHLLLFVTSILANLNQARG